VHHLEPALGLVAGLADLLLVDVEQLLAPVPEPRLLRGQLLGRGDLCQRRVELGLQAAHLGQRERQDPVEVLLERRDALPARGPVADALGGRALGGGRRRRGDVLVVDQLRVEVALAVRHVGVLGRRLVVVEERAGRQRDDEQQGRATRA